jgi:hypothetical protein
MLSDMGKECIVSGFQSWFNCCVEVEIFKCFQNEFADNGTIGKNVRANLGRKLSKI